MATYFGFTPSQKLQDEIKLIHDKVASNSSEPLYHNRDTIAKMINAELIENALVKMVGFLPPSDRKETLSKLANFIQAKSTDLISTMLSKADNKQVLKTYDFMQGSVHQDEHGQPRVGAPIPESLYDQLQHTISAIDSGDHANQRTALKTHMKDIADMALKHYLEDFNKTLDLNMIKRGISAAAKPVLATALHIALDKLIPSLNEAEVKAFTDHYKTLLFKA